MITIIQMKSHHIVNQKEPKLLSWRLSDQSCSDNERRSSTIVCGFSALSSYHEDLDTFSEGTGSYQGCDLLTYRSGCPYQMLVGLLLAVVICQVFDNNYLDLGVDSSSTDVRVPLDIASKLYGNVFFCHKMWSDYMRLTVRLSIF